jgi:hypothetical protein
LYMVYVHNQWLHKAEQCFHEMRTTCENIYCLENIEIKWIDENDFYRFVYKKSQTRQQYKLWKMIINFISSIIDYESLMLELFCNSLKTI